MESKMFILNNPYVSDFFINTIIENKLPVLENEISKKYLPENLLTKTADAINSQFFYSNSENSIDWIIENMPDSDFAEMIRVSKNKVLFREKLRTIFPDFFFLEIPLNELKKINTDNIHFPFILKPSVGFLSFGVYPIKNKADWEKTLANIDLDIEKFSNIFPKNVVNTNSFIIEEMIDGEEYAIDGYFDANGEATILNIFLHPFFNDEDVSDRAYYTSKNIIKENLLEFKTILDKVAKACGYKNFPFHLELRKNNKTIIPIELNPIRFCGWCITDIAYYAWGINVYEYFHKQLKPNWDEILNNANEDYYYFTLADIPSNINRNKIIEIDYKNYLKNISEPLSTRKIDYKKNPLFMITFAKTKNIDEIKNILKLDMQKYIKI